jgi:hypothetical protein
VRRKGRGRRGGGGKEEGRRRRRGRSEEGEEVEGWFSIYTIGYHQSTTMPTRQRYFFFTKT